MITVMLRVTMTMMILTGAENDVTLTSPGSASGIPFSFSESNLLLYLLNLPVEHLWPPASEPLEADLRRPLVATLDEPPRTLGYEEHGDHEGDDQQELDHRQLPPVDIAPNDEVENSRGRGGGGAGAAAAT